VFLVQEKSLLACRSSSVALKLLYYADNRGGSQSHSKEQTLIKFCFETRKIGTEIFQLIKHAYGENSLSHARSFELYLNEDLTGTMKKREKWVVMRDTTGGFEGSQALSVCPSGKCKLLTGTIEVYFFCWRWGEGVNGLR
jgi:hypothetical protein